MVIAVIPAGWRQSIQHLRHSDSLAEAIQVVRSFAAVDLADQIQLRTKYSVPVSGTGSQNSVLEARTEQNFTSLRRDWAHHVVDSKRDRRRWFHLPVFQFRNVGRPKIGVRWSARSFPSPVVAPSGPADFCFAEQSKIYMYVSRRCAKPGRKQVGSDRPNAHTGDDSLRF